MTLRSLAVMTLLAASVGARAADAQPAPPRFDHRVEVSGGAALAKTWDDEGSIGRGSAFAGTVLFPITSTISVGGGLARIPHDRETGAGSLRFQGDSTLASIVGKFTFGAERVRPFLSAGFGILRYSGTLTTGPPQNLPPGLINPGDYPVQRIDRSGTETFASGTGGVDIWIARNIGIRPSATLHMTQPSEDFMPWSIISGGVGLVVKW
jgi:hypothetical protein